MSLLMDALRRAEESKKKVVQDQKSDAAETQQAKRGAAKVAVDKADSPAAEAAVIAQTGNSKTRPGSRKSGDVSPDAKSKNESVTVKRKHKPKLELGAMSEASPTSKPSFNPEPDPVASPTARPVVSATTRLETDAIAGSEEKEKNIAKAEDEAKLQSRNIDRNSARALFVAKRQQQTQGKRLQLVGLGIVVILATGVAATFYLLPLFNSEPGVALGGGLEIGRPMSTAPEAIPVGQDAPVEISSTVIVEAPPEEEVNPVLSNQDSLSSSSQVNSQVIAVTPETDVVIERVAEVEPPLADIASATVAPLVSSNSGLGSVAGVTELPDDVFIDPAVATAGNDANAPVRSAANIEPTRLISFSRQQVVSSIDPLVSDAYAAYRRGSLDAAERLYRQVLSGSPQHRNALLGLIAIATLKEETGVAMDLYSQLLARDPSDPVARAGLLELRPGGSITEQERELKRLVDRHPEIAALAYALGNFYGSVQRWTNAQQAYYRALQLAKTDAVQSGSVNPDYAFNLAISLEHLNQAPAAQTYYLQALEFANSHPAGFDVAVARSRLENMRGTIAR